MGTNGIIAIKYKEGLDLNRLRKELESLDPDTTVEFEELYADGSSYQRDEGRWILIENLDRWFHEGYDRGYWPRIKSLIEVVRKYSENVYYYPDSRDFVKPNDLITLERLWTLDQLWSSLE